MAAVGRALAAAMATSCVLHGASDVIAQTVESAWARPAAAPRPSTAVALDRGRTAKFAVVGLCLHGPFFFTFFRALDRALGSQRTFRTAVVKSIIGQCVVFPVYLVAFFAFRGALDGAPLTEVRHNIVTKLVPTVTAGAVVWVPANMVNFLLVPLPYRVLFANTVGLVWQGYMSNLVAKRDPEHVPASTTVPA